MDRDHEIVKASVIGIAGNMLLVAFKLIIGFASHSIAIILDGVNNATDAISSVVTIIGTKLSQRNPDKAHPFGYGRIEYLTSVVIAFIILAAGLVSLRESVVKIIHPGMPSYSTVTIIVIIVAIMAKVALGFVFKHYGDKTHSESLIASGIDSNYDAVLSAGTLVVAFAQNLWSVNIDGVVGVIISLVVCKAGIDVLRDSLAPIIGTPEDKHLVSKIEDEVQKFPDVHGVNDVVLDNFGPNKVIGSLCVKVPDDLTAKQIGELTRNIAKGVEKECNVSLTVGICTDNTTPTFEPMKDALDGIIKKEPKILGMHAFYVDEETKTCYFDLVIELGADADAIAKSVVSQMTAAYPGFAFDIRTDTDYAE